MSNELRAKYLTGKDVYGILSRNADGSILNGSAYETPAAAHWPNYAITMTEQSTTGYYFGNLPSAASANGTYNVDYFLQQGESPATTDPLCGQQTLYWTGSLDAGVEDLLTQLFAASITYAGPVNPVTGEMTLTVGDSYQAADGRAILYNYPYGSGNTNLSSATITLNWFLPDAALPSLSAPATVLNGGTSSQQVQAQLASSQTSLLAAGPYNVAFQADLSDSDSITFMSVQCVAQLPQFAGTLPP